MITHFEAVMTFLGLIIGWLSALAALLWRARGWVDRRTSAEEDLGKGLADLAGAVKGLTEAQESMHQANQDRFGEIERRLDAPPGRGYARLGGR